VIAGFCAAAFGYLHYFALFSLAALAVVAAATLASAKGADRAATIRALLAGACVFLVVGLPWAASFASQVTRVTGGFWIQPAAGWRGVNMVLESWTAIQAPQGGMLWALGAIACVAAAPLLASGGGKKVLALGTLAIGPPVMAILHELLTGRPVLLPRTLAFSQCFALVFLGVAAAHWRMRLPRYAIASIVAIPIVLGSADRFQRWRTHAFDDDINLAAAYLKDRMEPSDLAVVAYAFEVNRLRYAMWSLGASDVQVAWEGSFSQQSGQQLNHVASLSASDIYFSSEAVPGGVRRVWTVGDRPSFRSLDVRDSRFELAEPRHALGKQSAAYTVSEFRRLESEST
jgi:hypothetical protein